MTVMTVRSNPVGAFWDLIDDHLGQMEFPPSKRRLADRLDVSPQTITNWQQGLTELPKRENIEAVASFVGKSYGDVLNAALSDTGYARGSGLGAKRQRFKQPPANEAG
jgi:transcriptional regulator with XRE-family HTH domain